MTNFLQKLFKNTTTRRGIGAVIIFVIIWHIGSQLDEWTGYDLLGIGLVPPPEIISAAKTTSQVIPMPTAAPVKMDGSVPGRTIFQKRSN